MGSTLPSGTRIQIDCADGIEYQTGQIVAFLWGKGLIAHRVVGRGRGRRRTFLLTRGDGWTLCDPAVPEQSVLGVVTGWWDGESWVEPAGPPAGTTGRSIGVRLAHVALALHPALAQWLAAGVSRVYRLFTAAPVQAEGSPDPEPEQAFLTETLRLNQSGAIPAIDQHINWQRTLSLATPGLHPYLAHRMHQRGCWDLVPPPVQEDLTSVWRANTMATQLRRLALRSAIDALDAQNIPVVVLKGMALAHSVYPDPTLRPMQDIDLWVPLEHLDRATDALRTAGFRYPDRTYEGLYIPERRDDAVERALELPGTPVILEVHGELPSLKSAGDAARRAWGRATPADLGGVRALVLHTEDLLLHVGLHFARQHNFRTGLKSLVDLGLVIDRWEGSWDWPALAARYQEWGVATWMRLALTLARDILGADVPDAAFEALPRPQAFSEMQGLATEQLWGAEATESPLPFAVERWFGSPEPRARWLGRRATTYFRGSKGQFGSRLLFDLRVKLPRYTRWLIRSLDPRRARQLRNRARLLRAGGRLQELISSTQGPPHLQG